MSHSEMALANHNSRVRNILTKDIHLIAFCHTCQQEYKPEIGLQYSCPDCNSPMEDIRSGRELKIDRIEYSSLAHAFTDN